MRTEQGITERLARHAAARPRRMLAGWGAAVVVALALVATALHGLSSNAHVVGTPESRQAEQLIARSFPPAHTESAQTISDVVVVSSTRYTADAAPFRALVRRLVAESVATGRHGGLPSNVGARPGPVSPNGHAALIQLAVAQDSQIRTLSLCVKCLASPA